MIIIVRLLFIYIAISWLIIVRDNSVGSVQVISSDYVRINVYF